MSTAPSIVRDLLYEGSYFAYIKSTGEHTYRQTFRRTTNDTGTHYPINVYPTGQAATGIVRPGKLQGYLRRFAASAGWSLIAIYGWQRYSATGAACTVDWKIPAGHNRIHFLYQIVSTGGVFQVSLGTAQGLSDLNSELDYTSIDTAVGAQILKELVLTTHANSAGEKYLRITTMTAAKPHRFIGIHSFDEDGVGDPVTTDTDGLWMGHDLIDTITSAYDGWFPTYACVSPSYDILVAHSWEFTINWRPIGSSPEKWTGIGVHYGPADAPYIPTTPTTLIVGGVTIGEMSSTIAIPLGTVYQNSSLSIYNAGKGDYNYDGDILDAVDCMGVDGYVNIDTSGLHADMTVRWSADSFCGALYIPRIRNIDAVHGSYLIEGQTGRYYGDGISQFTIAGALSAKLYPDSQQVEISNSFGGPSTSIFEGGSGTESQVYFSVKISELTGGANPPMGTVWGHLTADLMLNHRQSIATVTFDTSQEWVTSAGACLLVFCGRPKQKTKNFYNGPWKYATKIEGNPTHPPATPQDVTLPYVFSHGQECFLKTEIIESDGRCSNQSICRALVI